MGSVWKRKTDKRRSGVPWWFTYINELGKRRTEKGTCSKEETTELLQAAEARVLRRKHGVVSAKDEKFAEHAKKPITQHIEDYLAHCECVGHNDKHHHNVTQQLKRIVRVTRAVHLRDVDAPAIERYMMKMKEAGRAPRTINHHLKAAKAFFNWCVAEDRLSINPIARVKRHEERGRHNRRMLRRAATRDEFEALIRVPEAVRRGRHHVYIIAYWTGLRRNELRQLQCRDVDLEHRQIVLPAHVDKARKENQIHLHPQAVESLRATILPDVKPGDRVFRSIPEPSTFNRDCERAGIKREIDGRVFNFHALRMTANTHLGQDGVSEDDRRRFLRHSDPRITRDNYDDTKVRLDSLGHIIDSQPPIGAKTDRPEVVEQRAKATGTDDAVAVSDDVSKPKDDETPRSACAARRDERASHNDTERYPDGVVGRIERSGSTDYNPASETELDSARLTETKCEVSTGEDTDSRPRSQVAQGDGLQNRYSWVRIPPRPFFIATRTPRREALRLSPACMNARPRSFDSPGVTPVI